MHFLLAVITKEKPNDDQLIDLLEPFRVEAKGFDIPVDITIEFERMYSKTLRTDDQGKKVSFLNYCKDLCGDDFDIIKINDENKISMRAEKKIKSAIKKGQGYILLGPQKKVLKIVEMKNPNIKFDYFRSKSGAYRIQTKNGSITNCTQIKDIDWEAAQGNHKKPWIPFSFLKDSVWKDSQMYDMSTGTAAKIPEDEFEKDFKEAISDPNDYLTLLDCHV